MLSINQSINQRDVRLNNNRVLVSLRNTMIIVNISINWLGFYCAMLYAERGYEIACRLTHLVWLCHWILITWQHWSTLGCPDYSLYNIQCILSVHFTTEHRILLLYKTKYTVKFNKNCRKNTPKLSRFLRRFNPLQLITYVCTCVLVHIKYTLITLQSTAVTEYIISYCQLFYNTYMTYTGWSKKSDNPVLILR